MFHFLTTHDTPNPGQLCQWKQGTLGPKVIHNDTCIVMSVNLSTPLKSSSSARLLGGRLAASLLTAQQHVKVVVNVRCHLVANRINHTFKERVLHPAAYPMFMQAPLPGGKSLPLLCGDPAPCYFRYFSFVMSVHCACSDLVFLPSSP